MTTTYTLSGVVLGPSGAYNGASVYAYAASLFSSPPSVGDVPPSGTQGSTVFGPVTSGTEFGGNGQYQLEVTAQVAYYIGIFYPVGSDYGKWYWVYDNTLIQAQGLQGVQGAQGTMGYQGYTGPQGTQGTQGTQGVQGTQGYQGTQGPQGVQGYQGTQGNQGYQGTQGNQGVQGYQGVQGSQGNQGYQGNQGFQGTQGTQGVQGIPGNYSPTSVKTSAYTASDNDFVPVNATSASITITLPASPAEGWQVAVSSLPTSTYNVIVNGNGVNFDSSGTPSTITISPPTTGVPYTLYFTYDSSTNLWDVSVLEQGPQGVQGTQGYQGNQGTQGYQGTQGNQGFQGVQGSQGYQGSAGSSGAAGAQGNQGYQGTQGNQGYQGTQGPQGYQGTQGNQGNQGNQGSQGAQGAIDTTGAAGKNFIANGAMEIAQRGTSFIPSASTNTYTLDRWCSYVSTNNYTFAQSSSSPPTGLRYFASVKQTSTTSSYFILAQSLETSDAIPLQGKVVTVSFQYKLPTNFTSPVLLQLQYSTGTDSNLTSGGGTNITPSAGTNVNTSTGAITNNSSWTTATATFTVPTNATSLVLQFYGQSNVVNNAEFDVTAVQLEIGSSASNFARRAGSYQQELALCQRYYFEMNSASGTAYVPYATGFAISSTECYVQVFFPCTMRVAPSFTCSSTAANFAICNSVGGAIALSALPTLLQAYPTQAQLETNVSSGLTAGNGTQLCSYNNNSTWIAFSAEL